MPSSSRNCLLQLHQSDNHSENFIPVPNSSHGTIGHDMEVCATRMQNKTESLGAARALSNSSVLIHLNLSSTFDTVNHRILLSTLAELGIAESSLTWFSSSLTNRTSLVTWNGSLSKPCFLETGVPQGSVLGQLLFSLYPRSLDSVVTLHEFFYYCYADNS